MSADTTGSSDRTANRSGRQRQWWSLGAVAAIVVVLGVRPEAALACVGDCNGDGTVAVTELITAVNIALGLASLSECTAIDMNGDGTVAINELVAAVNSALGVCAGPTVTLTGSCAAPGGHGSHGLKPCAADTPITVFRCDDRTQCLHQQGLTMIGTTTVSDGGGWSVQVAPADASAALVFQASIDNAVVYRALGFGSVSGLLRAGLAGAASFAPVAITPVTEAGVDLLDSNGFANYSDAAAQQVLNAVDQATADLSFENVAPDMAAALAMQTASQDPTVMMVLQTVRNTATPTLTPTVTPTATNTSTATADPTRADTPTPTTPTPTVTLAPGEVVLQVGSAVGAAGSQVAVDVRLRTTRDVAGTQNDITFSSGVGEDIAVPEGKVCSNDRLPCTVASDCAPDDPAQTCGPSGTPDCAVNPLINKSATSFAYQPPNCCSAGACPGACTGFRAIVLSTSNTIAIPDGRTLYTCGVDIAPGSQPLSVAPLTCSNPLAGDPFGGLITLQCENGQVTVGGPGVPTSTAKTTVTATPTPTAPTPTPTGPTPTPTETLAPGEVELQVGSAVGPPGSRVTVDVRLRTTLSVAGTQNDITFSSGVGGIVAVAEGKFCSDDGNLCTVASDCAPADPPQTCGPNGKPACVVNPLINKRGTAFAFEPPNCSGTACTGVRAIVLSTTNTNAIPDGSILYTCIVDIAPGSQPPSVAPLACSNYGASDPEGHSVDIQCENGQVTVGSPGPPTSTATRTATATPTPTGPTPTPTKTPTPTETLPPGEVELQVGSVVGQPGSRLAFDVRLRTTQSVAGTQNDITFSSGVGGIIAVPEGKVCSDDGQPCTVASDCVPEFPPQTCNPTGHPDCTVNHLIHKEATSFSYQPAGCCSAGACPGACTSFRTIVLATDNVIGIPDGSILYTCGVDIAPGSEPLSVAPLTCSNSLASDPAGGSVTLGCEDGQVTVGGPGTPTGTSTPIVTATPTPTGPTATPTSTPTPTETLAPGEVELQVGSAVGQPGSRVAFDVRLRTTQSVAGTQNDITFSSGVGGIIAVPEGKVCNDDGEPCAVASDCALESPPQTCDPAGRPDCTANPLIHKDGTAFAYLPAGCCSAGGCPGVCTDLRALVVSFSPIQSGIPDGSILYTCAADIAPGSEPLSVAPLTCSNSLASDPQGNAVDLGCTSGQVTVGGP